MESPVMREDSPVVVLIEIFMQERGKHKMPAPEF